MSEPVEPQNTEVSTEHITNICHVRSISFPSDVNESYKKAITSQPQRGSGPADYRPLAVLTETSLVLVFVSVFDTAGCMRG